MLKLLKQWYLRLKEFVKTHKKEIKVIQVVFVTIRIVIRIINFL
jgi:hypothetical protein